jgi:hypothetical protein
MLTESQYASRAMIANVYRFRRLNHYTSALSVLLLAGAALALFSAWRNWEYFELVTSRPFTVEEALERARPHYARANVRLILFLATIALFSRWLVLAHRNLRALGAQKLDVTPGWAIGWFFVPVANLWKPYTAMRTLWQASHDPARRDPDKAHGLLMLWWGLWLITMLIAHVVMWLSSVTRPLDFRSIAQLDLVNSLLQVPLYIVAAVVLQRIWRAQASAEARPVEGGKWRSGRDSNPRPPA